MKGKVESGATILACGLLLCCSCYTQFTTLEYASASAKAEVGEVDSTEGRGGKVVKKQKDTVTIIEKQREICYWSYDFWGRPVLRCYESYYSPDWFRYYNSPWWYRSYFGSDYDFGRCPTYYYYDPGCGCCRHFQDRRYYYGSNSSSSRTPSRSVTVPRRSLSTENESSLQTQTQPQSSSAISSMPKASTNAGASGPTVESSKEKSLAPENKVVRRSLNENTAAGQQSLYTTAPSESLATQQPLNKASDIAEDTLSNTTDSSAVHTKPADQTPIKRRSF